MNHKTFRSILDNFNAASADIHAPVLMTKDRMALAGASPPSHPAPGYDEDRVSSLSASILHLGHKFRDGFAGGETGQVLIKGKGLYAGNPQPRTGSDGAAQTGGRRRLDLFPDGTRGG